MTLLSTSSILPLSALKGAHDSGDFNTTVENVSPTSPPLTRGAILCKLANGSMTLAGAEASTPTQAYGILLSEKVDPTVPGATCAVARNGTFDATSLNVDVSTNVKAFEQRLKEINILLEKVPLLP